MTDKLYQYLTQFYRPEEFPALYAQAEKWRKTRPLADRAIYDATPVFRNTMVKYYALLCAGAQLTVGVGAHIPCDENICRMLTEFGIKFAGDAEKTLTYDVVADCAGASRQVKARYGYVELTRSGLEYYADWKQPVFSADSGVLKKLETVLGTGEGFLRAMKQLGYDDFQNRNVLIFGGGKVGRGVAHYAASAGAQVTVADLKTVELPSGIRFVNAADTHTVKKCIADAWCIVSVTGLAGALKMWADDFVSSSALIANMGVEDEFGAALPASRVLNNKHPLNFILDEPTHLKYIDATMALNNYGIEKLIFDTLPCGINLPPAELEKSIVADIKNGGIIAAEMEFITAELEQ
ncbi:MAG: hypothetical protein J6R86_03375 [Lentisphaeria bacterium]|nr:hypothetical protein [Lentisphaeria bacterium]